jgi:hypothetical protein
MNQSLNRLGLPHSILPGILTETPTTLQKTYDSIIINPPNLLSLKNMININDTANNTKGIPSNIDSIKSGILKGRILVEVIAYRDITKPLPLTEGEGPEKTSEEKEKEEEHKKNFAIFGGTRTLKLTVTDGLIQMEALEYERTSALDGIRIGAKYIFTDVYIVRGIALLTPSNVLFMGAS